VFFGLALNAKKCELKKKHFLKSFFIYKVQSYTEDELINIKNNSFQHEKLTLKPF